MKAKREERSEINGYSLSRAWFDFAFENQGKITGSHGCMLMWFIELNNRMGWVREFGAPREQTMVAVGISSYNTYKKIFNDLVDWGFVKVVKESKNQWTANIIALSNFNNAEYKALDKALIQASECPVKNCESTDTGTTQDTDTGTVAINKPVNNETSKQVNYFYLRGESKRMKISDYLEVFCKVTIDQWMMHKFSGLEKSSIYDTLDVDYFGTDFKDENHLRNSFKFVGERLLSENKKLNPQDGSDQPPERKGNFYKDNSGKWYWINEGWRDTTKFTDHQKQKHGLK